MSSIPILSIVTVNLNNEIGLSNTLHSIVNQTWNFFELLVIDGGSIDSSLQVIEKYKQNIDYWISEPDKGIYHAMNKGIMKAKGEYCFFLNSGDTFSSNVVLEKVFSTPSNVDIIFGNLRVFFNGYLQGVHIGKSNITFLDVYMRIIRHQAAFIRRALMEKTGGLNENYKIVSDWEFFIKTVGLKNASYKYININVADFDNDGFSNNNPEIVARERQLVSDLYIPKTMQADYLFLSQNSYLIRIVEFSLFAKILRLLTKLF